MARNFDPARLARSVERFYEAAAQPALWRDALHEFGKAAGAEGAILHVNHRVGNPAFIHSQALDASSRISCATAGISGTTRCGDCG